MVAAAAISSMQKCSVVHRPTWPGENSSYWGRGGAFWTTMAGEGGHFCGALVYETNDVGK